MENPDSKTTQQKVSAPLKEIPKERIEEARRKAVILLNKLAVAAQEAEYRQFFSIFDTIRIVFTEMYDTDFDYKEHPEDIIPLWQIPFTDIKEIMNHCQIELLTNVMLGAGVFMTFDKIKAMKKAAQDGNDGGPRILAADGTVF